VPKRLAGRRKSAATDRRGVASVEFAMISIPFLVLLFFIFEVSMDLFQQEALDAALHLAVRQIQTGNAQNVTNGASFISTYMCPYATALLNCNNLSIKVQKLSLNTGTSLTNSGNGSTTINGGYTDYYNYTTGQLPMTNGALDLSSFSSASFCNSGPSEFLLVTAIYETGGIIGNLMPNLLTVSYGGTNVHATMSQMGAVTENFPVITATKTAAASC
jgi:Flp pilus assembly protein TadG